jgi:hypothetical protein
LLGRPLAVDDPRNDDELPLEAAELDQITHQPCDSLRHVVSTQDTNGIGAFGREAQATYLLSRVLTLINTSNFSLITPTVIYAIDAELQEFLTSLISQCAGTRRVYCGAIAVCIKLVISCPRVHFKKHPAKIHQCSLDSSRSCGLRIEWAQAGRKMRDLLVERVEFDRENCY